MIIVFVLMMVVLLKMVFVMIWCFDDRCGVMVMIAMKMEYVIKVTISHLHFSAGLKNKDKTQHTIAQI